MTNQLSAVEINSLRATIARYGEREVLRTAQISRLALARAVGGLPIHSGTAAVLKLAIAALAERV